MILIVVYGVLPHADYKTVYIYILLSDESARHTLYTTCAKLSMLIHTFLIHLDLCLSHLFVSFFCM